PRGDRQFRVLGGYDAVVRWVAAGLGLEDAVQLNHVVTRVRRRPRGVELDVQSRTGTRLGTVRARAAIHTLPIGVLAAAPAFDPPLPDAHREAIRTLAMGHVYKLVLRFRDRFWEWEPGTAAGGSERASRIAGLPRVDASGPGLDRSSITFLYAGPTYDVFWTALPVRAPVLVAWAGASVARRLAASPVEQAVEAAVGELAGLLGMHRGFV